MNPKLTLTEQIMQVSMYKKSELKSNQGNQDSRGNQKKTKNWEHGPGAQVG